MGVIILRWCSVMFWRCFTSPPWAAVIVVGIMMMMMVMVRGMAGRPRVISNSHPTDTNAPGVNYPMHNSVSSAANVGAILVGSSSNNGPSSSSLSSGGNRCSDGGKWEVTELFLQDGDGGGIGPGKDVGDTHIVSRNKRVKQRKEEKVHQSEEWYSKAWNGLTRR